MIYINQDVTVTTTMGSTYFVSARNRSIQLSRIIDGVSNDILKDECGRSVYLRNVEGIDLLGNTVQANIFSVNPEYYGYNGVHNTGHHIIGLASNTDPQIEVSTVPGVMEEDATSMPLQCCQGFGFYSILYARTLFVCHQHLDHQEFEYEIKIQKDEYAHEINTATVRLFLGPKHDLNGRLYNVEEQRDLMFIMDTFTISLKMGINIVRRKSTETQLTIDYSTSLVILRLPNESSMPFCGCGWPQHLLIPKGTKEGLEMYLFAMITNDDESSKYPDARPMNYPFDRRLYAAQKEDDGLEQVVRNVPNMAITQVKILHSEEFRDEFEVS
ncbi:Hemocyanin F chain [Orchesella cincta]|uniref:Hemocyanin F chain n=1 Tax=Orchesella cincta TaxID=48709 RepID=A0A1D2MGW5_ORCCI|nr:Hemocyanin F chain [Orchesella cincta]